jgi:hypothetical protein
LSFLIRKEKDLFLRNKSMSKGSRELPLGDLEKEVQRLKREASALNAPDTFSQSAKLARKAKALERELKLRKGRQERLRSTIHSTVSGLKWITMALVVAFMWGRPLVEFEAAWTNIWPVERLLRSPDCQATQGKITISTITALSLCGVIFRRVSSLLRN